MLAEEFRPDPSKITKVISDPQFREYRPALVSLMAKSRALRADAEQLLYLQAEMANEVIHLQKSKREFRAQSESGKGDVDFYFAADLCIGMVHVIRQIADGIAWRSLGYDRGAIRELAAAHQTGHMDKQTAISEITAAAIHVAESADLVILNDLTNFLRYGDLTIVSPDSVSIREVKAGKASARSRRAKRQRARIEEVAKFIRTGERSIGQGEQRLLYLATPPAAHVRSLTPLIAEARAKGSAHARLSDALAVEVFSIELMAERGPPDAKAFHNPFSQSRHSIVTNNLESFGRFAPNLAPYSVFPLRDADCVALMTGELWLSVYFNIGNFVRCLRRRGLDVRLPDEREVAGAPQNLRPGEISEHELDYPIEVTDRRKIILLSFAQLGRMEVELLDEECFANAVVELLATTPADEESLYTWSFEGEQALWD